MYGRLEGEFLNRRGSWLRRLAVKSIKVFLERLRRRFLGDVFVYFIPFLLEVDPGHGGGDGRVIIDEKRDLLTGQGREEEEEEEKKSRGRRNKSSSLNTSPTRPAPHTTFPPAHDHAKKPTIQVSC